MPVKRFVSWNVNGLRACLNKGFYESFAALDADAFCLQETRLGENRVDIDADGYFQFWNGAETKGYSGTAIFSREAPISVSYGLGIPRFDDEGRIITLEFADYYLATVYAPNSREGLVRLGFRTDWEDAFREFTLALDKKKPVVFCGDLNVAHKEIDLKNPGPNRKNAGFTDEERGKFSELLNAGFIDTFRFFHPDLAGAYSWWSYRFSARKKNAGWRIDYFIVSERLRGRLRGAAIRDEIFGSDHCPVELEIEI